MPDPHTEYERLFTDWTALRPKHDFDGPLIGATLTLAYCAGPAWHHPIKHLFRTEPFALRIIRDSLREHAERMGYAFHSCPIGWDKFAKEHECTLTPRSGDGISVWGTTFDHAMIAAMRQLMEKETSNG